MMLRYIILFTISISISMSSASAADFQKTWDNAADRRITIITTHGDIKLSGYDGKNIDITAVKNGSDRERVVIEDASVGNHISIFSRYLDHARNNATVDFEIRVPKEILYNAGTMAKPQGGRATYFQRFSDGTPTPPLSEISVLPKSPPSSDTVASTKQPLPSDASKSPKPPPPSDGGASPKPPLPSETSKSPKPPPPSGAMQFPHAIYLKSNSGQITISDVAGAMRVEGRNIEIHNVEGTLYASSGSGDIKGTLKQASHGGVLRLSSSSGNISLLAPDDIDAQVRIQSTTGHVKTDFPLETGEMRYGGKFIQGKLGNGNQILDIRSLSGSITFSKKPSETKGK